MLWNINPSFGRFPIEAGIIGRILASFGEIEVSYCSRAGQASRMWTPVMKALYALRATSQRLTVAEELSTLGFAESGLGEDYKIVTGIVWHCLTIRNQYAHCNWGDDINAGLFFADLQKSAETTDFSHDWKHIDSKLLTNQLNYFSLAMELLEFLHQELAYRRGELRENIWPRPLLQPQPPLQNPEEQQIPPWLSAEQKALHLARAAARQGGPPTPTAAQQALDRARAEKRARQAQQRRNSEEGERLAKERSDPSEAEE